MCNFVFIHKPLLFNRFCTVRCQSFVHKKSCCGLCCLSSLTSARSICQYLSWSKCLGGRVPILCQSEILIWIKGECVRNTVVTTSIPAQAHCPVVFCPISMYQWKLFKIIFVNCLFQKTNKHNLKKPTWKLEMLPWQLT